MREKLSILMQQKWVIPATVGVTTFVTGFAAGFVFGPKYARRRAVNFQKSVYEQLTLAYEQGQNDFNEAEEDEVVKDMVARLEAAQMSTSEIIYERPDPSTIETVEHNETFDEARARVSNIFRKAENTLVLNSDEKPFELELDPIVIVRDEDVDWSYEEELALREQRGKDPYILHRDEFFAQERGYTQTTLTYYVADDILTDEMDVPIYNHPAVVGELKFGHGSGDDTVVYIRNGKLQTEYEVVRDEGSYEIEVLGHTLEDKLDSDTIRHATAPRKFLRE